MNTLLFAHRTKDRGMGRELPFVGFMWTNTVARLICDVEHPSSHESSWVVLTLCVGRNMSFLVKQLVNRCQAGYLFFAPLSQACAIPQARRIFWHGNHSDVIFHA